MLKHLAIKCHADEICPNADAILHMDADCMFWDTATPDDFMEATGFLMVRERYDELQNKIGWSGAITSDAPSASGPNGKRWSAIRRFTRASSTRGFVNSLRRRTGCRSTISSRPARTHFPQSFCEFNTFSGPSGFGISRIGSASSTTAPCATRRSAASR
jgi:hypothetical protein